MRDNYVGDIGDFFKFSLLRYLTGWTSNDLFGKLRLGVLWYYYTDPCKTGDGFYLDYLLPSKQKKYEGLDPDLYRSLQELTKKERSLKSIRTARILPSSTEYYEAPLTFSGLRKGSPAAIAERIRHRDRWFATASTQVKACDVVFLDPDNGLSVRSVPSHRDRGAKFCTYRELAQLWAQGKSLIVYQHKNLHQSGERQIAQRSEEILAELNPPFMDAIYFPSHGGRIFFVIVQQYHMAALQLRLIHYKNRFSPYVRMFSAT